MEALRHGKSFRIRRTLSWAALLCLLVAAGVIAAPVAASDAQAKPSATYRAEIRRTAHGIPHILAHNYRDLGFGSGYVAAEDNLCVIAEEFLTLSGQRS